MPTTFNLEKDKDKVKFILEKRAVPKITAEVVALLDVSGSTEPFYRGGVFQEALQRIVPVALNFDDNGSLPVYVFSDGPNHAVLKNELTAKNYEHYVNDEILLQDAVLPLWGGTAYSPVLRAALTDLGFVSEVTTGTGFFKKLFSTTKVSGTPVFRPESKSGLPAILYFVTDGENGALDKQPTRDLIEAAVAAHSNVYFNFIGVGRSTFTFLAEIGDAYPNTGFAQIKDIERTAGSDAIYEFLLPEELTTWLRVGALQGVK